ncbi:MAG: hypothetical protein MJB14_13995, partial [Spirochaetes bacterium]|nr:hypothetical protein [Spirochaetota bacterium]
SLNFSNQNYTLSVTNEINHIDQSNQIIISAPDSIGQVKWKNQSQVRDILIKSPEYKIKLLNMDSFIEQNLTKSFEENKVHYQLQIKSQTNLDKIKIYMLCYHKLFPFNTNYQIFYHSDSEFAEENSDVIEFLIPRFSGNQIILDFDLMPYSENKMIIQIEHEGLYSDYYLFSDRHSVIPNTVYLNEEILN